MGQTAKERANHRGGRDEHGVSTDLRNGDESKRGETGRLMFKGDVGVIEPEERVEFSECREKRSGGERGSLLFRESRSIGPRVRIGIDEVNLLVPLPSRDGSGRVLQARKRSEKSARGSKRAERATRPTLCKGP